MSLTTNVPFNTRIITDPNYIVSGSVPAVAQTAAGSASLAATSNTPSVNFVQSTPYPTTEKIIWQVTVGSLTGTSGSLTYSFYTQHSSDNVTFVNIPQLTPATVVDSAGTASAVTVQYLLPPNVQQYVRVQASIPASGSLKGGLTGSVTGTVLF